MRTEHLLISLLIAAGLAGCSALGKNEDMPGETLISLSMYADTDVNPNPNSLSMDEPDEDSEGQAAPYRLQLSGESEIDLVKKLHVLLNYLRDQGKDYSLTQPFLIDFDPRLDPSTPLDDATTAAVPGVSQSLNHADIPFMLQGSDLRLPDWLDTPRALGEYVQPLPEYLPPEEGIQRPKAVATPIAFKVIQLKDDSLFLEADAEMLNSDMKKTLGSTYLDSDDYLLQPGQFKFIDYSEIHKKTRYIAVLANFHEANRAISKQILRIETNGFKYALMVKLQDTEVTIASEGYPLPQPRPTP